MKIKIVLSLKILCFLAPTLPAQTIRRPMAAPYTGFGAYSLRHVDIFSFTANQASLAQLDKHAIGIYAERRFMLAELNHYTAVAGVVTGSGNFGVKAKYSGFTDYNETQLGLAYGRKLGNSLDIGTQFNYNGIAIAGYGNASTVSFELGMVLHLTERVHAGLHINNPMGGKFGKDQQEKIPAVYTTGIGYHASEKFFAGFEIQKEEDEPVNVNAGIQYRFIPQLLARAGFSSATSTTWLGLGLTLPSFRVDITTSYHSELGITPGLLLLFAFNQGKQ